ncbi:MAG: type II secretion system protein GspG, partial [Planctomycetota bacterium]
MKTLLLSRRSRSNAQAGFSLAELMVVIVIIGLLVTLVVPNVMEKLGFAQTSAAKANIVQLSSALNEYAIRNGGNYPDSLEALVEPDENGVTFLGRKTLPLDPWKQEFYYEAPGPGEPRARIYS